MSYSHKDENWKDRLVTHLGVLTGAGLETWDDRRIAAGDAWQAEIETALAGCDAALLLISAHFLTSSFILRNEIPALMQRREQQGMRVIPVILRPCAWSRLGWLKAIQARPKDGKPLYRMSAPKAEQALADLAGEIHELLAASSAAVAPVGANPVAAAPKIDLSHLPDGAPHFLGRKDELAALDAAWAETGRTHIVQLIAPGGTGKTSLVTRWVDRLRADHWRGAQQVFAWSFYSQGSGKDRQASEDGFLEAAIKFFGVTVAPTASPWDKGAQLADAVAARRSLLILDSLEPLQYPPGHPLAGELKAPGLQTLLKRLAAHGQPGLALVTSREHLANLADRVRDAERPDAGVLLLDLGNLAESDGARLLYKLGVTRAGAAAIPADAAATDAELLAASREVQGHALTLNLLGSYLARAWGGDVRKRDIVDFARADERSARGHAFRAMAAYETWLARAGVSSARELAALKLVGFFDRPASRANLAALRQAPAIAGLTEALTNLDEPDWNFTLANLARAGLVRFDAVSGSLDAHPLVREYFAECLERDQPEAWREGHRRIYEQLETDTPDRPDGLAGLQPLYQAVAHGCKAGRYREALNKVYVDRVLRGTDDDGYYSIRNLGSFGTDLGALAGFFTERWSKPNPEFSEFEAALLLGIAGHVLRSLSRLREAEGPMSASAKKFADQGDWSFAAQVNCLLAELQLGLGKITDAVASAHRAIENSKHIVESESVWPWRAHAALAVALHQRGDEDVTLVEEAKKQVELSVEDELRYRSRGFSYGELLLAPVECAAWRAKIQSDQNLSVDLAADERVDAALKVADQLAKRAEDRLRLAKPESGLLQCALDHLTLARCAVYVGLLRVRPACESARDKCDAAVSALRAAGQQDHLPRGLLTRAWMRHACGNTAGARADLDEVETIASRGGMKLHLADLALTRARLFHDRAQLTRARELIAECGYGRRLPELADAEASSRSWPTLNASPPPAGSANGVAASPPGKPGATGPAKRAKAAAARKPRKPAMSPETIDFLIVTPLPEERDAVLARLPGHRKLSPGAEDIRVYYAAEIAARFPDGSPVSYATVLLPLGGMGHTEAATATADAVRRWNPRYVLLVGIAGGIAAAGVKVGDLLIADQIADYELAKVLPSGPQIRWQVHPVDKRLLIAAQNFDGGGFRGTRAERFDGAQAEVHFGPICTGNKVVADDSLAGQLRDVWAKMIGVEMEAAGVANAAFQAARQPGFFMVRGVSDLADAKKDSRKTKRWRPYACEIAAAWTVEFLQSGPVPTAT